MVPRRDPRWDHSCESSCMTISYAFPYLLEQASSASRTTHMAPEKTEALLVMDRRSFRYPKIVIGKHEVAWSKNIKYLRVQLDRRLAVIFLIIYSVILNTASISHLLCTEPRKTQFLISIRKPTA